MEDLSRADLEELYWHESPDNKFFVPFSPSEFQAIDLVNCSLVHSYLMTAKRKVERNTELQAIARDIAIEREELAEEAFALLDQEEIRLVVELYNEHVFMLEFKAHATPAERQKSKDIVASCREILTQKEYWALLTYLNAADDDETQYRQSTRIYKNLERSLRHHSRDHDTAADYGYKMVCEQ